MNLSTYSNEELQAELDRRIEKCEARWCEAPAIWEGWYKNRDGFGIPTGLVRIAYTCNTHKNLLGNK